MSIPLSKAGPMLSGLAKYTAPRAMTMTDPSQDPEGFLLEITAIAHQLPGEIRQALASAFQALGMQEASRALTMSRRKAADGSEEGDSESSGYSCPVLQHRVYHPCTLRECHFNVPDEARMNCARSSETGMDLDMALAITKERHPGYAPEEGVSDRLSKVLLSLQSRMVEAALASGDLERTIEPRRDVTRCAVCNRRARNPVFTDTELGLSVCSARCTEQRSIPELTLEWRFGVPYSDAVAYTVSQFRSK